MQRDKETVLALRKAFIAGVNYLIFQRPFSLTEKESKEVRIHAELQALSLYPLPININPVTRDKIATFLREFGRTTYTSNIDSLILEITPSILDANKDYWINDG